MSSYLILIFRNTLVDSSRLGGFHSLVCTRPQPALPRPGCQIPPTTTTTSTSRLPSSFFNHKLRKRQLTGSRQLLSTPRYCTQTPNSVLSTSASPLDFCRSFLHIPRHRGLHQLRSDCLIDLFAHNHLPKTIPQTQWSSILES